MPLSTDIVKNTHFRKVTGVMEVSIVTLIGQLFGLLILAVVVYVVALIPVSLKRIATELAEIKQELRRRNESE